MFVLFFHTCAERCSHTLWDYSLEWIDQLKSWLTVRAFWGSYMQLHTKFYLLRSVFSYERQPPNLLVMGSLFPAAGVRIAHKYSWNRKYKWKHRSTKKINFIRGTFLHICRRLPNWQTEFTTCRDLRWRILLF